MAGRGLGLVMALCALLAGCVCPAPVERFRTGFEDCGTCGWTPAPGSPPTFERVTTFHPGEHALRLRAGTAIQMSLELQGVNELSLVTSCPGALEVQLEVRAEGGVTVMPLVISGTAKPDLPWTSVGARFEPGDVSLITGLRISTLVDCDIDEVRLLTVSDCF